MRTIAEIEAQIEAERKAEKIWCPYCGAECRDDEDYRAISYHGYHDHRKDVEFECLKCEREFLVREYVKRTFESFPKEPSND